ncbi:hypothetical protein [Rubrimonas cliftonensis]|uniref:Heme exporter protein D n=1 Tax=Rubrimonas cliftonensis TaxID=89524 RepID=A0A1H3VR82_9RHOB|nr:hypothetical protein [Rubrimonas cliftonensis]SDZ77269.1 hypothetical protein SAMN05444370_101275 [Rubrimonas cliftonensis]
MNIWFEYGVPFGLVAFGLLAVLYAHLEGKRVDRLIVEERRRERLSRRR